VNQIFQLKQEEENKQVSTLVNPFLPDSVSSVKIEIYSQRSCTRDNKLIEATIWFRRNNTNGWHKICADTLEDVLNQIKITLESL